jgi:hypothetical protein
MNDLVKAAIAFVILGVIGYVLLVGAAKGWLALPTGFGLFDQTNWLVRIATLIVLVVIAFGLYRFYIQSKSKS